SHDDKMTIPTALVDEIRYKPNSRSLIVYSKVFPHGHLTFTHGECDDCKRVLEKRLAKIRRRFDEQGGPITVDSVQRGTSFVPPSLRQNDDDEAVRQLLEIARKV